MNILPEMYMLRVEFLFKTNMATTDPSIDKEKSNFLAAYHILKFSQANKDDTEVVDIERRCLAVKYLTAKRL